MQVVLIELQVAVEGSIPDRHNCLNASVPDLQSCSDTSVPDKHSCVREVFLTDTVVSERGAPEKQC